MAKKNLLESELRKFMRLAFPTQLEWTEAARGGTVGLPDVRLNLSDNDSIPIELKAWELTAKGVRAEMRPAQRRYMLRGSAGTHRRAAILAVAVYPTHPQPEMRLHLIPAHLCPIEPYGWQSLRLFDTFTFDTYAARNFSFKLMDALQSDDFWNMERKLSNIA